MLQLGWDGAANQEITQPFHSVSSVLAGGFILSRCFPNAIRPIWLRYAAGDIAEDVVVAVGGRNNLDKTINNLQIYIKNLENKLI